MNLNGYNLAKSQKKPNTIINKNDPYEIIHPMVNVKKKSNKDGRVKSDV